MGCDVAKDGQHNVYICATGTLGTTLLIKLEVIASLCSGGEGNQGLTASTLIDYIVNIENM